MILEINKNTMTETATFTAFDLFWQLPTTKPPTLTHKYTKPTSLNTPKIPVRQQKPILNTTRRPTYMEVIYNLPKTMTRPVLTHNYIKPSSLNEPKYTIRPQKPIFA